MVGAIVMFVWGIAIFFIVRDMAAALLIATVAVGFAFVIEAMARISRVLSLQKKD